LLALIGVSDLFGAIGSGWLSDRFDNLSLLVFYYLFRGLALVWLVSSDPSTFVLVILAVFYGLDFIATVPSTVKLTTKEFGAEYGPVVFAWFFTTHHIAASLMLVLAGISHDSVGIYVPAFAIAGILCVLAGLIILVPRFSKVAP
jgi:predicted MFS family arabinose efflux permease